MQTQTDPRWDDIRQRRAEADGQFFYSVRSTGVYCRPSCPSRQAQPENIAFHASAAAAEAAGFRPCKRCDPKGVEAGPAAIIASCCRLIETAETAPSLADLARHAKLSPHHLHRLFKAQTGLTPKHYAAGHRAARLRNGIASGQTVTAALYDAGYNASSRFYAEAAGVLGMPPAIARRGGSGETIFHATGTTRFGTVLVASTVHGICDIRLGDAAEALLAQLRTRFPAAELAETPDHSALVAGVIAAIEQGRPLGDLPLDIRGTAFQMRVWQALRAIPPGSTASYAAIAARIGALGAARAVARACATNQIAIAIPCHRVVAADGALSGYRWGIARKRALLAEEGTTNRRK